MHALETASHHADLLQLVEHLTIAVGACHAALEADLSAPNRGFGRYGALLGGHLLRASAQQLVRVRELLRVCEQASVIEAAHAISVAGCILLAETRALRSDFELLFARDALREAG